MAFNLKFLLFAAFATACVAKNTNTVASDTPSVSNAREEVVAVSDTSKLETATLAGGCFWKMDASYQQLRGVTKVDVGYAGGTTKNPTYEDVSSRTTGHAETVQVVFDPKVVSYREILEVFWTIHDATVLNQEGNDMGNDYRSAIFYRSDAQKKMAEIVKDSLDKIHFYPSPIVTAIEPFKNFYRAEQYHQNYYNMHPNEGYTYNVVRKKEEHFEKVYAAKLKKKVK